MSRITLGKVASLLAGLAIGAGAQETKGLVIEHARVFDGNTVKENTAVLVENGVIRAVGAKVEHRVGTEVIDATGKTLIPGLIDSHTHTIAQNALKQAAVFGVTTTLDMFTEPRNAALIKKRQQDGALLDWADLRSAGYLATAPGGHGTEYGLPVPTLTKPEEAQTWVDARIAEGSDYIKAVYDDAVEYGGGRSRPTLSKETLGALAVAAHTRGKLLVVHIGSLQQAIDAIQAGADGLVHLFVGPSSSPDFGKLTAEHHAFVIPTLSVLNTICSTTFDSELAEDRWLKPFLGPSETASLKASFGMPAKLSCEGANEAIRQLKASHVPILAGTDAGNPGTTQGASIHGELELLVRAGLTPAEALHAVTAATAAAFHLDDRGQIAAGKRADLVLVNGDPTKTIQATRDIAVVWKAGHVVDRAVWKESVSQQIDGQQKEKSAPAPPGSESGLVSDFEQEGAPMAKFGAGWSVTTDSLVGGKSQAKMSVSAGGAEGSKGALLVTGDVIAGYAFPWAGVMFSPGPAPMMPANLSSKKGVRFWVKGGGQTYQLMVFARRLGYQPARREFVAGPEWREITMPWTDFGIDGSDVMGIAWTAGPKTGTFELRLDRVRVE
jgi:imidazolonepropionase-like amidohydrolase